MGEPIPQPLARPWDPGEAEKHFPPSLSLSAKRPRATLLQPEPGREGEAAAGTKHSPFLSARRKICKTKHNRAQCGSRERRAAEQ